MRDMKIEIQLIKWYFGIKLINKNVIKMGSACSNAASGLKMASFYCIVYRSIK